MTKKEKIKIIHEHVMDAKYIKPMFDAIDYSIENNFQHYGKQFNSLKNQLKRSIKMSVQTSSYIYTGYSVVMRIADKYLMSVISGAYNITGYIINKWIYDNKRISNYSNNTKPTSSYTNDNKPS
jgi:hypothetical protein